MTELRFDDRVAIVTGAGQGLGRAHALLLASRGAKVLVNDLGGSHTGDGSSTTAADRVVAEIRAAGGVAEASHDSVEDGERIVKTALDKFGRVDIVINNAGILRDVSFPKMSAEDWDKVYRVHVLGAFRVTHAAWGPMREQGYGRVIFTASAAGLYGNFGQANYSMAKLGLVGLSNALAVEGLKRNVLVNAIAPLAGSRMTESILPPEIVSALRPELVSGLVACLVHESQTETGGVYEVGGGFFSKLRWERTRGVTFPLALTPTPEQLAERWATITDFKDATRPGSVAEAMLPVMENLSRKDEPAELPPAAAAPAAPPPSGGVDAEVIFRAIALHVEANAEAVKKLATHFRFELSEPAATWTLDLKEGRVSRGAQGTPDCTLSMSTADFVGMASGKLDAQKLYFDKKLKIGGNVMASQKLGFLQKIDPSLVKRALAERGAAPPETPGDTQAAAAPAQAVGSAQAAGDAARAPELIAQLNARLGAEPARVRALETHVSFRITEPTYEAELEVPGATTRTTLRLSDADLGRLASGQVSARSLFQRGLLRVDGDVRAAHVLELLSTPV